MAALVVLAHFPRSPGDDSSRRRPFPKGQGFLHQPKKVTVTLNHQEFIVEF